MNILKGMTSFPGLVKGRVCLHSGTPDRSVSKYNVLEDKIENEIKRMKETLLKAKADIEEASENSNIKEDEKIKKIFEAHAMILSDIGLIDKIEDLIKKESINAEHAVEKVFNKYIDLYKSKDTHFKELAHDFIDIKGRILKSFYGKTEHLVCPVGTGSPLIIVTEILTPSMVLDIPRENVQAFITKEGGYTTHSTILARAIGIPVIFGVDIDGNFSCGDFVIINGFDSEVIISPDQSKEEELKNKQMAFSKKATVCELKKSEASCTGCGTDVKLKLNISTPQELELVKDYYHDGIGLLRTEFLFLDRSHPPTEEEQFHMYKQILEDIGDKEVVIRLLDVGSDKWPLFFESVEQVNPDMEIKGARAVEYFYNYYVSQVKAIFRASMFGKIKILFPMVSDLNDIATYNKLCSVAQAELKKQGENFKDNIPVGIMIETPAAALMADVFLKHVDFANIGSNDLLQYTLAASRGNPFVEKRYHILHPALIKLLEIVIDAGQKNNKEICLCGEIGSFEQFYPILLQIGIRSFSVIVSKYSYLKCEMMHVKIVQDDSRLERVYNAKDKDELEEIINQ